MIVPWMLEMLANATVTLLKTVDNQLAVTLIFKWLLKKWGPSLQQIDC